MGGLQNLPYRKSFVPIVEAGLIHHETDRLFIVNLPAKMNFHGIKVIFKGATNDVQHLYTYFTPLSNAGREMFKICRATPDMQILKALKKHALHYDKVIVEW
jgi:hypothetical protein